MRNLLTEFHAVKNIYSLLVPGIGFGQSNFRTLLANVSYKYRDRFYQPWPLLLCHKAWALFGVLFLLLS